MDTEKNSPNRVIFVHADLDLYGLSPYEFRLYAHVARRGECFSSLETIANICKMSVRKAQYGLKSLEKQGLIKKKIRKGRTDVYELTSRVEWKEPEYANKLETERQKVKESLLKSEISTEIQSKANEDDIEF